MRRRLSGRIDVALPTEEAFQLFTPNGEREWVHGWNPRFPAPTADDAEPGTVFETDAHGQRCTWLVTDRVQGKRITYGQVIPGERAGSIAVTVDATAAGTEAEVVYDLTSLSDTGADHLEQFANGYGDYLRSWRIAIAACLAKRKGPSCALTGTKTLSGPQWSFRGSDETVEAGERRDSHDHALSAAVGRKPSCQG